MTDVYKRQGIYKKAPSKKKENEPCEWVIGRYPGEKVQVDVKLSLIHIFS